MFDILLSKKTLGLDYSILYSNGAISPVEDDVLNALVYGDTDIHRGSIEDIFPVLGVECPEFVTLGQVKSFKTIFESNINWYRALGKKRFVASVKNLVTQIEKSVEESKCEKYIEQLIESRKILERLKPAKINTVVFNELIATNNNAIISSFEPDENGFTQPVRYSHATATGRLSVNSGPKILSLRKDTRNILKSRFPNGKIIMVDFVSLEPRVAFLLTRDSAPLDIYEAMRYEMSTGNDELSRNKLKVATLSALYGNEQGDKKIQRAVKQFFRFKEITKRYLSSTELVSLYDRPLHPKDKYQKISYFIQSSAVDIAMRGFEKLMKAQLVGTVPLFLIHDALIIDAPNDIANSILSQKLSVHIEPLGEFILSSETIDQ